MLAYVTTREGRGGGHYEVPFYPWSESSRYTMIAKVLVNKDGVVDSGLIPCYIEKSGNVVPRNRENGGQEILDFIKKQTDGAFLGVSFEWSEDGTFVYMR